MGGAGRPHMVNMSDHLWWRDLKVHYRDSIDDREIVEAASGDSPTHRLPEAHWYFSRETRKVSHQGVKRDIRVVLYRELGPRCNELIEDPAVWMVVANGPKFGVFNSGDETCTDEDCVSPYHCVLIDRRTWMEGLVRVRREKRTNDMKSLRERAVVVDGQTWPVGSSADTAYLSKLMKVENDPASMFNENGLLKRLTDYDAMHEDIRAALLEMLVARPHPAEVYDRVRGLWKPPRGKTLEDTLPAWRYLNGMAEDLPEPETWHENSAEIEMKTKPRAKSSAAERALRIQRAQAGRRGGRG